MNSKSALGPLVRRVWVVSASGVYRHVAIAIAIALALATALGVGPGQPRPAWAQDEVVQLGEPGLALDGEALLTEARALADRVDDPVWDISPQPGRRLVALPLTVTPGEAKTELGTPSVSVRAGRFIVWLIVPDDAEGDSRRRASRERDMDGRQPPTAFPEPTIRSENAIASLHPEAPRVTRQLTVHPDGRIAWRLERAVPGGEVQERGEGYTLRLRPNRLREMEPPRPERLEQRGGESRAEFAQRRREQDREYMEARRELVELRREVLALPDEFETALPSRLWAIFEVPDTLPELTVTGDEPPLPWSMSFEDLESLRAYAGAGRRSGRGEELAQDAMRFRRLVAEGHEISLRMVAHAMNASGAPGQAAPNDPVYNLLLAILRSDDARSRHAVLGELAALRSQTTASLMLLRFGAEQPDATMKLLALRGLMQNDPRDEHQLTQMVNSAMNLVADEQGPDPALVFGELLEVIGRGPDVVARVADNISFERLSTERLDGVIRYLVQHAGTEPIAAHWLDRHLLGSANPNLVQRTLQFIARSDTGSPWVRDAAHHMLSAVFGRPADDAADDAAARRSSLASAIPIETAQHALFRSLNSGHEQIRELAWQALRNFSFTEGNRGRRSSRAGELDETGRYEALLDAALGRPETPAQVVPFFARQPDARRATLALVRLVIDADAAAAGQAARALLGSGRPVGEALAEFDVDARERFGIRTYDSLAGRPSRVAGLLRDEGNRAQPVQWLGEQLAEGSLPEPGDWLAAYRDERDLLAAAGSSDASLAAGAVAALVYSAGGDRIAVDEQVEAFAQMRGSSLTDMEAAWASARQGIYARRLAGAAGSYRLVALVVAREQGGPAATASAALPVEARIMLGVVDLVADGQSVSFRNDIVPLTVPDSRLAIRIERVHELQNFAQAQAELDDLDLERVDEPLDLLPRADGSWRGSVPLMSGQHLALQMEPVD